MVTTSCTKPPAKLSTETDEALKAALVYQWKEFSHYFHSEIQKDKSELNKLLHQLNSYIENETFFAGSQISEADQILFDKLHHSVFTEMSFADKQKYLSLSRWFDHVQSVLPNDRKKVVVSKNLLY